jgi:hypothetical protein
MRIRTIHKLLINSHANARHSQFGCWICYLRINSGQFVGLNYVWSTPCYLHLVFDWLQVERFACLYTSQVTNLCYYSPDKNFRTCEDFMPHEFEEVDFRWYHRQRSVVRSCGATLHDDSFFVARFEGNESRIKSSSVMYDWLVCWKQPAKSS